MENENNIKAFKNFSSGKYSYNEYLKVKNWFLNTKKDELVEDQLFYQWKSLQEEKGDESLHRVFERIHYRVLLDEKERRKLNPIRIYRYAAAILIPIAIFFGLNYFVSKSSPVADNWVEINAPEGARIEFLLPDSTTGWLNGGAKLKYSPIWNEHRRVELHGEAFFSVRHIENSDFTVSVRDMDIKVLGTRFNVSAYNDDCTSSVVLEEGKVEVTGKHVKFKQILIPGDKVQYNNGTKSLDVSRVDPLIYSAWTSGYLIIDGEPMEYALKKIERWYNVSIILDDESLKHLRLKATFLDEPLEEVLSLISITTPIQYEIERRNVDSSELLTKKQIRIRLK